ncbi:MAG TPA: LamG-like jellyroll fold domain-containing protein [Armatimonadota bacterium]|nr:LamG-like jellyroll fold domain-containing protein [Armatimonadota bacterium]
MVRRASSAVAVGVAVLGGFAGAAAQTGPVLEYRFDEGEGDVARDLAGGREGGITSPGWVRNARRAALALDGRETVVVVEGSEELRFSEGLTTALWFNAGRATGDMPSGLIVKSPTFRLLAYPGSGGFLIEVTGANGERIYEKIEAPIEIGRWHHVALTYVPSEGATLYFDGVAAFHTDTDIGPLAGSGSAIRIGLGANPEQRRYFDGMMANVKLYDRAISAQEVRRIMTTEKDELSRTFRGPNDLVPDLETDRLWDVGGRKQLFIDERLIESSRGVSLRMNPPEKLGPVILPDKPWEDLRVGFCDAVMEYEGEYRLYYSCMSRDHGNSICLATSTDGVTWEKPNLGAVEFQGSTDNNIVLHGEGETVVFLDPHGKPEERFKSVGIRHWPDPEKCGLYVHSSADGIHWNLATERVFPLGPDTANMAMWDAQRAKYVAHIRVWAPMRKVGRVEMDDITKPWPFTELEKPYYIWGEDKIPVPSHEVPLAFGYDEQDPLPSDHYNSGAVEYPWAEAAYFMFPAAYLHFPEPPVGEYGNDGLLDIQLATSRDGVEYERLTRQPYIPLSLPGEKDSQCLYMATGVIRNGDDLLQYYAGYEISHGLPQKEQEARLGSICAARQRLDGFISADADHAGGELLTPPLTFEGDRLELNIDCSAMGECRVEIMDERGEPIPGFAAGACDEIHGNHIRKTVTWQGESDVSALAGTVVRLRLEMRACKLYALQFGDGE